MSDSPDRTFRIIRFFQLGQRQIVREGLSLSEAREWCQSLEASSRTCASQEGQKRTRLQGSWFDGFEPEAKG